MSTKDKINVYISSKHRLPTEKANDFIIKFPSGLIKCDPKKEYMVMNINGYIMMNNFYNIQNVNNTFKIIILESFNRILSRFLSLSQTFF